MVPNAGDFITLEWAKHGKALVHGPRVNLLSACAIASRVARGRGNVQNIVCPCIAGPTTSTDG
jgi:hypothetical protein